MSSRIHLLWEIVRATFLAEEKNSVLGLLWHVLNPLVMTAVLYVTFSSIGTTVIEGTRSSSSIGLIHFNFFTTATARAAEGMLRSRGLIINTTVPLKMLVLRSICVEGLTLVLDVAVVCVLVQLLGGGNGQTLFALPDLRALAVVGAGQGDGLTRYAIGQVAGADEVPIETAQVDTRDGTNVTVNWVTRGTRNNGQPALALNYIICVSGIRPSQRD